MKDAQKDAEIAAIDSAISNLNNVMQAASAQMYQGAGAQADPNAGAQQQANSNSADDIQDADFEEVK